MCVVLGSVRVLAQVLPVMGGGVRYIGEWGSLGPKVKGIVTYSLAPFQQRALAGILSKGIHNVYRRFTSEFLNFAPGLLAGYGVYYWAEHEYTRLKRKDPSKFQ